MAKGAPPDYDKNVFINCPFDDLYKPLFQAIVFAIFHCGLRPRCALEVVDTGEVRFEKIARIVGDCRWGIHDISRTGLSDRDLPRFNMPLELGLFLGARRFGAPHQRRKSCLVVDRDRYRYQEFISDIAGQDIAAHGAQPSRAIKAVRDWLASSRVGFENPPGAVAINRRFIRFVTELPALCVATERDVDELTFIEFADAASIWLRKDLDSGG